MIPLLLLLACSGSPDGGDDGTTSDGAATDGAATTTDGGTTASGDGGTAAQLYGSPPAKAIPAPEFVATNRDGSARSREDLLGHPTVMWFYPAAATAG